MENLGRDDAEMTALQALAWLAGQPEVLGRFLLATGTDPDGLRARAAAPEFLGAVLDFLLEDDALIRAFCDAEGLPYDRPRAARVALPGGQDFEWI